MRPLSVIADTKMSCTRAKQRYVQWPHSNCACDFSFDVFWPHKKSASNTRSNDMLDAGEQNRLSSLLPHISGLSVCGVLVSKPWPRLLLLLLLFLSRHSVSSHTNNLCDRDQRTPVQNDRRIIFNCVYFDWDCKHMIKTKQTNKTQ